jgi:hypothetical protein
MNDYELVEWFVKTTFIKKRIKLTRKTKQFKKCIVIPASLNEGQNYVYNLSDKTNLGVIFMMIYDIIKNTFSGFDTELLNSVIYKHLGIEH